MQTTVKKTSEKVKSKETVKDDGNKGTLEDSKRGSSSVATPRNYLQKSSTTDIYAQKKKNLIQASKAPKKVSGTSNNTANNVSPMKDLLKNSSSVSLLSTKSAYDKKPKTTPLKKEAISSPRTARETRTTKDSSRTTRDTPRITKDTPRSTKDTPRSTKDIPRSNKTTPKSTKDSLKAVKETPKTTKETSRNIKESTKTKETRSGNNLHYTNVTVNSPIAKRRLNKEYDEILKKEDTKEVKAKSLGDSEVGVQRQRTKTRTLDEDEVKVLTPDVVDNNAELLNLTRRLNAKPKVFYVDFDGKHDKVTEKISDEDISYEDDFESYESDFESYQSEQSKSSDEHKNDSSSEHSGEKDESDEQDGEIYRIEETNSKEAKDDEKMLDSGNFDLRDQRSAHKARAMMDFIQEASENGEDKKPSLTDEGFQDMSSSSAVSSMRTVHVDVLDRPLFIDFSKSKETKRKRKVYEELKQRAKDLLSMITLHEMSYSLFEMKPIPYDLYMATFGRSNYTQIAVQTFDDGITEEVQTEEILCDHKWTQHPVEFSNHDVYLNIEGVGKKYSKNDEDYLTKFTFLTNKNTDGSFKNEIKMDEEYTENPLRIFLEQKDGVGDAKMLPFDDYKSKVAAKDFNMNKLRKFLKNSESRVSNILSCNAGDRELSDLSKISKLPFSRGFVTIAPKNIVDETYLFLKHAKITDFVLSESKSSLIMTIHKKSPRSAVVEKCIICLWDISVARREPLKLLVAIDNVAIGRYRGNTDGVLVAALEDGSIHLWDLSEEPTWLNDVASEEKPTNLVEIKSERMTQTEIDREWNLKNSNVGSEQSSLHCTLQACAFTSSAANMNRGDVLDGVVGLEFIGDARATVSHDGGRKIVGQICSLQRTGTLTIWSIVQEKRCTPDIGKAFWSKMKLERTQTISLVDHIDIPIEEATEYEILSNFNLNSAKRRLSAKKQEKVLIKKEISRPKSALSAEFDIDRPASAASLKRGLSVEKNVSRNWESGVVCFDLKVTKFNKTDTYLVAKNCGDVLCCTRNAGVVKINRFSVATDTSSITCLEVSPQGLPYFLAATESGTVNLCSMVESRVLLTLDCRNVPDAADKCRSDHKGRYISSVSARSPTHSHTRMDSKIQITSVNWSHTNPCCIYTLVKDSLMAWDLTHSDICARSSTPHAAVACAAGDGTLALLTTEGEVQVHKVSSSPKNNHQEELFLKYVTLL